MSFFRSPDYTSEFTAFLDGMKANQPAIEAGQRAGRAIWWDKAQNLITQATYKEARVPQKPYVYSTSGHPNGRR